MKKRKKVMIGIVLVILACIVLLAIFMILRGNTKKKILGNWAPPNMPDYIACTFNEDGTFREFNGNGTYEMKGNKLTLLFKNDGEYPSVYRYTVKINGKKMTWISNSEKRYFERANK